MIHDVDNYLDGRFNEEERAAFERELAGNPDLRAELEAARELREDLHVMRLRTTVKKAISGMPEAPRTSILPEWLPKWFAWVALSFLIAGGAYRIWKSIKPNASVVPATDRPASPDTAVPPFKTDSLSAPDVPSLHTAPPVPRNSKSPATVPAPPVKSDLPGKPVAQTESAPTIPGNSSDNPKNTRGETGALSPALKRVLDTIGPLRFDPAGRRFEGQYAPIAADLAQQRWPAANTAARAAERAAGVTDTLALLRGYALLGLAAPADAAGYLRRLDRPGQPWLDEVWWLLGRCALLQANAAEATAYWKRINPNTDVGNQARTALQLIGRN